MNIDKTENPVTSTGFFTYNHKTNTYKTMGILSISSKSSDLNSIRFKDKNGKVTEGGDYVYVPEDIGIGGGDYVELDIDKETGQIQNWKPVSDAKVIKAMKKE